MAPSFSMTLRRAAFRSCFASANFVTIPARIMRALRPRPTSQNATKSKQRAKQRKKVTTRLTVKVLRQLGIVVPQLRRFLGDHLELVRNLGELAARGRQVRGGRAQITLQLRHPRLERRLLASGIPGGIPGGGLSGGRGGLGPLGDLLSRRRGRVKLLNLGLGERKPRRQRVPLGGSCCGGDLGGGGAILCLLAGGFKRRSCRRLARHGSSRRHPDYDKLHLQLGPFRTKLAYYAGPPPT
jgi:hypothetical protein